MKFDDVIFPHPVLGLGDSISSYIELLTPEINSGQDIYDVELNYRFDNVDLKKLAKQNKVEYFCEVSCTNTIYREVFTGSNKNLRFQISKKDVKGIVKFVCLLVTKDEIKEYTNADAHPDYDGFSFDLDAGEVLAYFGEFSFNADIKYEKLKAVSSFMEVVEGTDLTYTYTDLKKDKIQIQLPTEEYSIYCSDTISLEGRFASTFHSSIVLAALLTALYNFEEHKDYLWAKSIVYRLENDSLLKDINFSEKENIPEIAQRLLGNPFKRLLNGLNSLLEDPNLNED
ncbi:MAG TPA: hypothetical protein VK183_04825 [Flavobacterium sp.]|nr:hypothetical protein [Flavobacterium sp.]